MSLKNAACRKWHASAQMSRDQRERPNGAVLSEPFEGWIIAEPSSMQCIPRSQVRQRAGWASPSSLLTGRFDLDDLHMVSDLRVRQVFRRTCIASPGNHGERKT